MDRIISRRDFLKIAGLGLGAMAFKPLKPIEALNKASIEIGQEKSFETARAIYTPFFERHTDRDSDQRIINVKPDCLFIEYRDKTDPLLNSSPLSIINRESQVPGIPPIATGKFLSEELLRELDKIGASVAIEGIDLPSKLEQQADIIKMTADRTSSYATLMSLSVAIERLIRTKKLSKSDYTRVSASTLALLWTKSDELSYIELINSFRTTEETIEARNAKDIAVRLHGAVTLVHPEDVIIFMRNIFMSLKLITISEQKLDNENKKIKIPFRIGGAHGAASDMVKMGKDITIGLLSIYSNNILKHVIEYNTSIDKTFEERIEDFCKTIVIPVREARMTNTGTRYLTDEKLKDYLLQRFSDQGI
jgi:hypothetical protein